MKNKDIVIAFGILSLLMSLIYITTNFNMFLFFFIIFCTCFIYSRKELLKIFAKPIIKRICILKRKKKKLEEQIKVLENSISEISIDQIKKYKATINELAIKDKELRKQIIVLEAKREQLEAITNQEKILSKALKSEEITFNILSEKNTTLEKQKEGLLEELKKLKSMIQPIKKRKEFIEKCSLSYIDNLEGFEFERFCIQLLKNSGYEKVENTKLSVDYGIDIIAERDNIKYAIQCKRYEGKVGNDAIQEAMTGKEYYECNIAIVMTNSIFTKNAERLAESAGVILWDRYFLQEMIERLKEYETINKKHLLR